MIRRAVAGVKQARGFCDDVEFSPEDATRTEIDFLCQVVEAAIAAGATTVNIPDTVGYATPQSHGRDRSARSATACRTSTRPSSASIATTTSGMAVANSLAAVEAGAGQIECTINGLGERAGNCSLEEIVMALRTRGDYYRAATAHQHQAPRAHQPAGGQHHRHPGAAEQGHRRPKRLRPRGRHPPGRHPQGTHDLRNHASRGRRLLDQRPGAGQAQRPGRAGRPRQGDGLHPHAASNSTSSSSSSKSWPTRRRRSTTPTSPP